MSCKLEYITNLYNADHKKNCKTSSDIINWLNHNMGEEGEFIYSADTISKRWRRSLTSFDGRNPLGIYFLNEDDRIIFKLTFMNRRF